MAYPGRWNEEAERGDWENKGEEGLESGCFARTRARSMFGDKEGTSIRSACSPWIYHQLMRACMGNAYESVLLLHLNRYDWVTPAVVVL